MSKKLILLLILGTNTHYFAQDKVEQAIETLQEKYPQEKIHLFFNKNSYIAGENMWFKSFVFDGYSPSAISTNLFLELYDSKKTLIDKKLIPLSNGEGTGNFNLPESLKEDVYYIRAYTTWMTNFSEGFQLIKPILVYNPSSPEKLDINTSAAWTASIYPESGTFIDGINTKFAVRLASKGTIPSEWNGYIIDTEKPEEKITSFKGFDQNVGVFRMTPKNGKKYQLIVEDYKGNKQNVDLPAVSSSGINLQVENNSNVIKYSLKSNNSSNTSAHYRVLGTINNQLAFKTLIKTISNEKSYSVPTENLPNGILQIVVLDDQDRVINQRLCFIKPDVLKIAQPSVQASSLSISPRASNSLKIDSKSNQYNYYTVMVADGTTTTAEEESSLLSTLWLTGDLTSTISKPAQYFAKNHNSEALDALLISEKWKRFNWASIISGNFPTIKNKPESYISYKGKVSIQGKPAPNTDLNLIFDTAQGMKFHEVKTDENGFFSLNGFVFDDSLKFSYQLNGDKKIPKEQVQVIFQPNYSFVPYQNNLTVNKYILTQRTSEDPLPSEVARYVITKNNQKTINEKVTNIEEIKIKGQKKNLTKKLNDEISSSLFKSSNEVVFDFVNDNNGLSASTNIIQWLQGKVGGLQIRYQAPNYVPVLRGETIKVYLDEMPIDLDQIQSISMSDIAMVKVIKGFFMGTFGGSDGAIAIYTRRGGSKGKISNVDQPTQLRQISLKGYDKIVPFTNPLYDDEGFKGISKDVRNVLYWNTDLESNPKESATAQFYNNDEAKNYRVIILGFDKENDTPVYYNELINP
ncbi:hypothetical protein N6B72_20605 [Chryseobacterium soli]|uniref:hypothetical protein n=1 Tax=Chryseobacterium soli TaxID=445961 RepID=UPI002955A52A|nr:hypothetical protein [Chryseobacterium soli]MDV7699327.1 hypothetical protein [Chryseobacterium soli]